ncbi:MAG: hypothetical protein WC303_01810 [Candidatus Paceibacterota bacterium]|jgi:hypothetical protein
MEKEIKRILGIMLIITGLVIFYWDVSTSYQYYTAKEKFPQIFVQPEPASNKSSTGSTLQDQMNALITQQLGDQVKNLIPTNAITETLNASLWSLFAMLLLYASGKAVGMGRDFLKDAREIDKI